MRTIGRGLWGGSLVVASLLVAVPSAHADVVSRSEAGFVVRLSSEVTAPAADAWKTVLTPAQWWQSQHTFSGDAANISLDPEVGGCFCEVLPRPEGAPALQKPGGVQHMRVIYIEPPRALRLSGALGPLQSEALAATMTITIKPTEKGSRILFEYVVGGFMRYKVDEIAPAVDRMLAAQLASLAARLGPVSEPAAAAPAGGTTAKPPAGEDELPAAEAAPAPVVPISGAETYSLPPAGSKAPASRSAPKPAAKPAPPASAAAPAAVPAKAAAVPAAAAKSAPKPGYLPPAKPAAKPASLPLAKSAPQPASSSASKSTVVGAAAKPGAKSPARPAAKAPDPEADAHRDANAAFDAALSGASNKP